VKVLVDTHALHWWLTGPEKLTRRSRAVISNRSNEIVVSAAIAWEMAIKVNLGKLNARSIVMNFSRILEEQGFSDEPVTLDHAVSAGLLPLHHRDPFDRMLVAQAQSLNAAIVSADSVLDSYGVKRIW
jgi:PIN domain nuclease of toxin-antitoxin system